MSATARNGVRQTGSGSARRLPRPFRGADRPLIAGVSALPHRHHGGDRLHRAAPSLPAGSRYIMIRDRRSNRMKPDCPPDRDGNACVTTTTRARPPSRKGQTQAVMAAQRFDCHGLFLQAGSTLARSVARNAPSVHRQSIQPHSMPIALMAGGAV